jgi:indole-3-glycerol phosphate synthase
MSILTQIIENKRQELQEVKSLTPLSDLKASIKELEAPRSFKEAIRRESDGPLKLIAELKKASPSKGLIRENFNLSKTVSIYDKKDVAAISVLTEKKFFSGSLSYLNQARKKTEKPLLRKDFIFNEYQVYEARANRADALLLIVAALDSSQLNDLYCLAKDLSLDCLVEVHDWKELDRALYSGAEIIGINNRNLQNFEISLNVTLDLLKDIPDDRIVVSESGISTRADVELIGSTRADAILVGTTIMKSENIGAKIDELMGK